MDTKTLIQEIRDKFSYNPETGVVTRNKKWGWFPAGSPITTKHSAGYIVANVKGKIEKAHRIAWVLTYGAYPSTVDHINGVKDDNRLCNLREASMEVNAQNRVRRQSNNTTGFLGVTYHKQAKKFMAQIQHKGKQENLGLFDTPEAAHAVYLQAKRQLHEGCTI